MKKRARFVAMALMAGACATSAEAQVVYYGTPVVATGVPAVVAPAVPMVAAPVVASPVVYAAPVATVPAIGSFYQVKRGGRLESVAKLTGVSLADLVRLNPLLNPREKLPAGTLVALPIP